MKRIQCMALAVAMSGAMQASAAQFNQVIKEKSALTFVSKQMNVPVEGKFNTFSVKMVFDPAKLQDAKAQIDLDMGSIDAGSNEANDEVKGKDWFDVKTFPQATFVSTHIRSLGGNRYEVTGPLTIKGKTHPVTAPFTFMASGSTGTFAGAFNLKRSDYGIGGGAWSDPSIVANEVQIKFHIIATVNATAGASAQRQGTPTRN